MWGQPPSAVQPSKARRSTTQPPQRQIRSKRCEGGAGLQACVNIDDLKTAPHPCINHYGPRARPLLHPRPHSPTPRPHHNRRRPAPSRSSRSSPLHQPPRLPKPGSHGGGSRHRSSRPTTATPPPPRSSFRPPFRPSFRPQPRNATVDRASFPDPSTTPPERRRRSLRYSRRLRRRPPPEPSPDADLSPGRRNRLRPQRRNSPKSPPPTPPLKSIRRDDEPCRPKINFVIPTPSEAEGEEPAVSAPTSGHSSSTQA